MTTRSRERRDGLPAHRLETVPRRRDGLPAYRLEGTPRRAAPAWPPPQARPADQDPAPGGKDRVAESQDPQPRPAAHRGAESRRADRRTADHRGAASGLGRRGPAAGRADDEAYLDGLFTYCLSIMCEHDAATAALGETLALVERRRGPGRVAAAPELQRPWLYALARWVCVRRLAADRDARPAAAGPRAVGDDEEGRRRRRELASLAWPEAAGTTTEQREALELVVRHQLSVPEVARVLRLTASAAHALLTTAACEVERTRAALAAVDAAGCPAVAALSGDDRMLLLGPGLRRELVRHVDECPSCRLVAQRAMAAVGWIGASPRGASRLAVLAAPRPAVRAARLAIHRARAQHAPRYDRAGFPVEERDRAARREPLRGRAVTTTVVAAVLAAPLLALWAAYRSAPEVGEPADLEGTAATAEDGVAFSRDPDPDPAPGGDAPAPAGPGPSSDPAEGATPGGEGRADERPGAGASEEPSSPAGQGRLTVDAVPSDVGTRITLTATGDAPVSWSAATDAPWLVLDRAAGTLRPGESAVVEVTIDREREPAGPWQGRITFDPAAAVITVEGDGAPEPPPASEPPPTPSPEDPGDPEGPEQPEDPEEPGEPPAGEPTPEP
ncbi:BACON domain-containing protein [Streptomyces mayteni]